MRHSYTLFICALLAVISLTACKDDFDIDKVKSTPKLILYCMPTVGDTTVIALTRISMIRSTERRQRSSTWATDRIKPWHTNRSETA